VTPKRCLQLLLGITPGLFLLSGVAGPAVRELRRAALLTPIASTIAVIGSLGLWKLLRRSTFSREACPPASIALALLGVGLLGYIMKAAGWPRPPFILGFVLGPVLENAMSITWQSYTVMEVVTRPTVIGLVIVLALVFFFALRSTRRGLAAHAIEDTQESKASLILSSALALVLMALFGAAVWMARDWKLLAKVSPMAFGLAGIVIMGFVLFQDRNRLRVIAAARRAGDALAGGTTRQFIAAHRRQIITFLSIALMAALTPWVGTYAAILGFAAIYTTLWGRFRWWVVALYTAGLGAVLYFLYDRLLHAPFELPFFM